MVFPVRPQLSSLGPQRGPGSADWEEHGFKVGGTFPGQSWPWRERGLLPPPRSHAGRLRGAAGGGKRAAAASSQVAPETWALGCPNANPHTSDAAVGRAAGKGKGRRRGNRRSPAGGSLGTGRPSRWRRGAVDRLPDQKEEKKTMAGEGFGALHLGRSPHSGPRSKSVWSSLLTVTSAARPRGRRCRRRPEL